jgi:hypothetical protein
MKEINDMETIRLENIEEIKTIYIHDSKIINVDCDYNNQLIKLMLDTLGVKGLGDKGIKYATLEFNYTKYIFMSFVHPWGDGISIISFDARKGLSINIKPLNGIDISNSFLTEFILNSGDKIEVVSEVLKYETSNTPM